MIPSARRVPTSLALTALLAALAGVACNKSEKSDDSAQAAEGVSSAGPGDGHKKHELPPAAFDACTGKAASDACTVQFGDKQIEAQCSAAARAVLSLQTRFKPTHTSITTLPPSKPLQYTKIDAPRG